MSGTKSTNLLAPNYVPGLFKHVKIPVKRCLEREMERYQRRQAMMLKKRRNQATAASIAVLHESNDGTGNKTSTTEMHEQENNQEELPSIEALNAEIEDGSNTATEREPQSDDLFGIMQELVKTNELLSCRALRSRETASRNYAAEIRS